MGARGGACASSGGVAHVVVVDVALLSVELWVVPEKSSDHMLDLKVVQFKLASVPVTEAWQPTHKSQGSHASATNQMVLVLLETQQLIHDSACLAIVRSHGFGSFLDRNG